MLFVTCPSSGGQVEADDPVAEVKITFRMMESKMPGVTYVPGIFVWRVKMTICATLCPPTSFHTGCRSGRLGVE